MSDGGRVIETIDVGDYVWINTQEKYPSTSTCALYVERTPQALSVSEGDILWWKEGTAYWTPKDKFDRSYAQTDIKLTMFGNPGVERPPLERAIALSEK